MTLQALIDDTPADSVLDLRGQTFEVAPQTLLSVPRSMTVLGGTIVVPGGDVPTRPLLDLSGLLNGARVELRDTTITGPDTTGWDPNLDVPHGAINWVKRRTWDSTLILDGVTITGGYGGAVIRDGGGRVDITNSHLEGWVYGLAFFEGHGGHGALTMHDTTLEAPAGGSKVSSVGTYIHPHLDARFDSVDAERWNRFAVYFQGNPQGRGNHDLTDVSTVDCALIQTGTGCFTTLTRCSETGDPGNGGSIFEGDVLSVGSVWGSSKPIGLLKNMDVTRRFVGDVFCGPSYWVSCGADTKGRVEFIDCTLNLGSRSSAVQITNRSTVAARLVSCDVSGSTRWVVNVEGGSVEFVDMPVPSPVRVVPPGVML